MTFSRASLVYLGVIAAFGLGLAVGPLVGASGRSRVPASPPPAAITAVEPVVVPVGPPAPRLERVPRASAEPVQRHVRTLLSRGTDVRQAAEGFANAYQFMTVAYAAKNTAIPFVVLKHRVLDKHQPLAAAIAEFKPDLDEVAEVNRARASARAELARIRG